MGIASGAFIGPSPTRTSTSAAPMFSKGMLGELADGSAVAIFVVAFVIGVCGLGAWRWVLQRRNGSG